MIDQTRHEKEKHFLTADGKKESFPSLMDPPSLELSVVVPSYNEELRCELIWWYRQKYVSTDGQKFGIIKGIVHPKVKITLWCTHPQAILGVYDFLLKDEYSQSYIKAFPSFIMEVNGGQDFEAQKSASIHHIKYYSTRLRRVNKGLLKVMFVWKKYP